MFSWVGFLICCVLAWVAVVEPLRKEFAETGTITVLGRVTGPSGITKLAFIIGGCLILGVLALTMSRQNPNDREWETIDRIGEPHSGMPPVISAPDKGY